MDRDFSAGTFVIRATAIRRLRQQVGEGSRRISGVKAYATREAPKVAMHELAAPRIALVHTWLNTQNEGWYRIAFDRLQIPLRLHLRSESERRFRTCARSST